MKQRAVAKSGASTVLIIAETPGEKRWGIMIGFYLTFCRYDNVVFVVAGMMNAFKRRNNNALGG